MMSLNVGIERLCEPVSNGELSQDGRTQESVYDEGDESIDVPVQRMAPSCSHQVLLHSRISPGRDIL